MESLRSYRYWCLYSSFDVVGREREVGGVFIFIEFIRD